MDPEQERYERTKNFLTSNASKSKVARLGRECLELAKGSPLTDPENPWLTNEDGVRWKFMATLPLNAASHAHFYLEAMGFDSETTRFLQWGQLRFQMKCDGHTLKSVLEEIIGLIENHLEVCQIDDSIENRAAELTSELDKLFAVDLQDFSVSWALEMFHSPGEETRMKSVPSVLATRKEILQNLKQPTLQISVFLCLFSLFAHIPIYYILWRKWSELLKLGVV